MATPWGLAGREVVHSLLGETPQEREFRDEEEGKIELYLSALSERPQESAHLERKVTGYIG